MSKTRNLVLSVYKAWVRQFLVKSDMLNSGLDFSNTYIVIETKYTYFMGRGMFRVYENKAIFWNWARVSKKAATR